MAETELYDPVKRFLEAQGFTVKAEIGACDVMALRGDEPPVIVELKLAFSLPLIFQGIERQTITDAVYLAIAAPKRQLQHDAAKLCRLLGLGLLLVATSGRVEPVVDPLPYRPRKNARRRSRLLKEFRNRVGDPNRGGSTRRPLVTAYRQDALRCARLLGESGPTRLADIRAKAGVTRAAGILQDDVYGWFQREARGVYGLSPKGQCALADFRDALEML